MTVRGNRGVDFVVDNRRLGFLWDSSIPGVKQSMYRFRDIRYRVVLELN